MSHHHGTISQIKSIVLDLWLENIERHSYTDWHEALNEKFKHFFNVRKTGFLVYNKAQKNFLSLRDYEARSLKPLPIIAEELLAYNKKDFICNLKALGYDYVDDYILFRSSTSEPLGILLIESSADWRDFAESSYVTELEEIVSRFIGGIRQLNELLVEGEKFRLLFNITESFASTMTSGTILDRMLETVKRIVPSAEISLILSREQPQMAHSYRIFNQVDSSPSVVKAFLNGVVTTELIEGENRKVMNSPIKGHQGVYGVLKLEASIEELSSSTQKDLIRILVNTAGNALENASLYHQSHRLNEDLKLVNETSRKLNSSLTMKEMLVYLKAQLEKVLHPSEMFFVFDNDVEKESLVGTDNYIFQEQTGKEYIDYISRHIQNGNNPLFDADFNSTFTETPVYKSIIGIPILNQGEVMGMAVCLHEEKYFFSFDNFKLMESMIIHASLSISNLQLREKMQELADKDHLTGIYVRRYIEKYIQNIILENKGGLFLLFDVDDFKFVNDKYGHDIGDIVLQQIGECLSKEVEGKGVAARWGGEEFAVYMPIYEENMIENMSKKLLDIIPDVTSPSVTVSIGLVYWEPDVTQCFKTLFKEADTMLYEAKKQGKNRLVYSS